jgi:hypothetical protein
LGKISLLIVNALGTCQTRMSMPGRQRHQGEKHYAPSRRSSCAASTLKVRNRARSV